MNKELLLKQYKDMAKIVKDKPHLKQTQEYVTTIEALAQVYALEDNYIESNKLLEDSRKLYYNPSIDHAYGMHKMFLGDYKGFSFYHNRYKKNDGAFAIPNFPMEQIRSVYRIQKDDVFLVLNEQGIGDEILFNRVIPFISERSKIAHIKVRKELFEYFKNKYSHLKNIVFFTGSYNQEKVNEFTSWALIGDLFASMTEEDMFKTSNKNVVPFKLSTDKLNIGISYSHGTLDNTKESAHVLQIKSKRGVPQEWFVENLVNKGYNVVDYTYNTKIDTIKGYQYPKDFMETYNNLKKENINLVVTIDSAFGHFTADMGIPTIIVINQYKDWRWSFNYKDYNKFFNNIKVVDIKDFNLLTECNKQSIACKKILKSTNK